MTELTHLDESGAPRMVDVSDKPASQRRATARGTVQTNAETLALVTSGTAAKGDVLITARLAGIMAAKRTAELIPLTHPLPLTLVDVSVEADADNSAIVIEATVATNAQTGVEMEALTAVSVAALTVYDMLKSSDRAMRIGDIRLLAKSGGRSGDYFAEGYGPESEAIPLAAPAGMEPAEEEPDGDEPAEEPAEEEPAAEEAAGWSPVASDDEGLQPEAAAALEMAGEESPATETPADEVSPPTVEWTEVAIDLPSEAGFDPDDAGAGPGPPAADVAPEADDLEEATTAGIADSEEEESFEADEEDSWQSAASAPESVYDSLESPIAEGLPTEAPSDELTVRPWPGVIPTVTEAEPSATEGEPAPLSAEIGRGSLTLQTGARISNLLDALRETYQKQPELAQYDLVGVGADNALRSPELQAAAPLIPGFSPQIIDILAQRDHQISEALNGIKAGAALSEPAAEIPWDAVRSLIRATVAPGIGLSRATKILHKKRPALIPVIDEPIMRYALRVTPNLPSEPAEATVRVMEILKQDLDANLSALLRTTEDVDDVALTPLRVLDLAIRSL